MKATANIQNDKNTATQKTNKIMEDGEMNNENNNINMVTRLSKGFRKSRIGKLFAGAAIGLALTAGVAMSILGSVPSSNLVNNYNDDFSMVYGIPDTGLELGIVPANFTVAGLGDMSEENLEIAAASFTVAGLGTMSEEKLQNVPASFTVAGFGNMSEENLEIVPASFTVAGFGNMSEENLEIVPASFSVAGLGDMSEENLEIVPGTFTVAGLDDMSEESLEIVPGTFTVAGLDDMSEENTPDLYD